ncbi:alpha/beta fold hydrolase [Granulicella arctica]|uniref:alpha/beta fold hydrolase n=1 Tax=Granulicella arctica TaxID=940613 RepID=UPI0021E0C756|nr:alpha/beta hydrolase [Granulicella arctica]
MTLILMPFLGGTQREWTEVVEPLSKTHRCVTIDLPGFGEAASISGFSVGEMTDALLEVLASLNLERYLLIGHSMSGKLTAVMARRIVDGTTSLPLPTGLVLIAPSPPGPEPMSDSKREQMLAAFANRDNTDDNLKHARKYIEDNISRVIPAVVFDRSVEDVLHMNTAAWTAWLDSGSKEDWAERVGTISLPTLVIAGDDDGALGPAVQQKLTQPHFPESHMIAVVSNHLITFQAPDELTALITNFLKVF